MATITQAMELGSGEVTIRGWVHRERKSNQFAFLVVRDSTNIIQCIVEKEKISPQMWDDATKRATIEASVIITGIVRPEKRAPSGYEIAVSALEIVGDSHEFPITKDQSPEFLLDKRHLWLRSRKLSAIMKVRSTVMGAIHDYFRRNGYFEWNPPIFTPNACEGGATLFEVKYFNEKVYLTQSWQLYAEAAIFALEKIYCIAPCFRAERSKTSRHLAEFWMAEVEGAWLGLHDMTALAEGLITSIIAQVIAQNSDELAFLGQDIEKLRRITGPFHRMTYGEVLKFLKENDGMDIEFGKDLRTIEEDALMKHFDKPVIVTNYPKEIMAFYKPEDPQMPGTALCFDMLAPEGYGEIIGGSQRETDIGKLKEYLTKQGEKSENYEWYFDTRRYGSVPHAGFGMGVERIIAWICKLDNIKDAIPFPRTMLRKNP
ncbi:asparagine--tRNA ligase [Candidatus Woesearchaeota archaeon]|nr:asparagine--tRNA ligase [Candidatus Woesearchaeota archaeon]